MIEASFPHEQPAQPPGDPLFGPFFDLLRGALSSGGSEFGLGMTLFSLAVSIRAVNILEIGRFKGFSTLALAGALRFNDMGWNEPTQHKQRPDVDYAKLERRQERTLISIDPYSLPECPDLLHKAGLMRYVQFCNCRSDEVDPRENYFDLILIDGDHGYDACLGDVQRFLPAIRPGGYFVLHDYFGWYEGTENKSPIADVCHALINQRYGVHLRIEDCDLDHLLIDTGYQSFVVFRKNP